MRLSSRAVCKKSQGVNIHNKSVVTENGYKSLSDTQSLQCP